MVSRIVSACFAAVGDDDLEFAAQVELHAGEHVRLVVDAQDVRFGHDCRPRELEPVLELAVEAGLVQELEIDGRRMVLARQRIGDVDRRDDLGEVAGRAARLVMSATVSTMICGKPHIWSRHAPTRA